MRRALPICVVVALVLPATAFAHASLLKETPSYKQEVPNAPHWIALTFDQSVELIPKAVVVLSRRGVNFAKPAHVDGSRLIAPLRALPRGPYTVRWRALSSDGHVVAGVYTFGVAVPAPPVTDAVGAEGPTTTEHIVRWVYFLGLALLVGGIGFQLLVVPARADRNGSSSSRASARSSCSRPAQSRSCCARRTRCSSRSATSSTATCRRSRTARASARRSSRWSSGSRSSPRSSCSPG